MKAFRTVLLAALCSACAPEEVAPSLQLNPDAKRALPLLHAHNDYEHPRPLFDALEQRFQSVEADVYFKNADLEVSHDGANPKGTLRSLYLDPLKARIEANGGSVHGDGQPFFLWIDLKEDGAGLRDALTTQLAAYDFLTHFDDQSEVPGAVTVILSGNDDAKEALTELPSPRPFTRDSNVRADDDPPADTRWGYYSLNYLSSVNWTGTGQIPEVERRRFEVIIAKAHEGHRRVRFFATPETPEFWQVAIDLGLDFIGTDQLVELRSFANGD